MNSITHPKILARFWECVDWQPNGCWLWTAGKTGMGYGAIDVLDAKGWRNKKELAHRFSYELHKGPIPKGLTIDHLCRTKACVNPLHLEAVTHRENTRRGLGTYGSSRNAPWHEIRTDTEKRCPKCDTFKPFSEYYTNNRVMDKLTSWCKSCYSLRPCNSRKHRKPKTSAV